MNYKKLNNLIGWAVFAIAFWVYFSTAEETVSLWDCGEYISTSHGLQVGHPPGAPLFNMIGRMFTAFVETHQVAFMINLMSALCSAFSILFLFWTITFIGRKLATLKGAELTESKIWAIMGSGIIGGLAYTFSDSFWFSAVEGEVYAMSSFFTAVVVWAIFKWDSVADEEGSDRWIVFIMFLIGLSIGVHLLNLLAIPAMGFVYYFRRYPYSTRGFLLAGVISIFILGLIQGFIVPGMVSIPADIERWSRNSLGMPFNLGTYFFFILLIAAVVYGIIYSHRKRKAILNLVLMSFSVLVIGYSCFGMIIIRSQANPPIDENNPENFVTFLSYLNREQYGSRPLLSGPYWNSPPNRLDDGSPVHMRGFAVKRGEYTIQGFRTREEADAYIAERNLTGVNVEEEYFVADSREKTEYGYQSDYTTILPRMYSRDPRHIESYLNWSGYDATGPVKFTNHEGRTEVLPTFSNNLQFLFSYQIGWMYWRYFMWNFAGRQSDEQNINGNPLDGNWISGVKFIDDQHIGKQDKAPSSITGNKAHNNYYMLPLILGIIGMLWQLIRDPKNWFVVFLLFFFTGIAIILYLNSKPSEPRERDYAYVGSFYAFAIWIGLGVYALFDMIKNLRWNDFSLFAAGTGGFVLFMYLVELGMDKSHVLSFSLFYIALVAFAAIALVKYVFQRQGQNRNSAIAATLLCLPVPIIMGVQNWDDHDRTNRSIALDLAHNYLIGCEENAILFTHGDNDTFPLWYAQEVEGIRRDVRVINLSLLGTDWYIDQMMRRAYESAPVPFSFPEHVYRQGGPIDQVKSNAAGFSQNLIAALDSLKNEDTYKVIPGFGRKAPEFKTRNFFLPVDKDKVIANKVVEPGFENQIVDTIRFSLPKEYLFKNDVMVLDLIARFGWERPIYFAGTADAETYLGLADYFELDGLNYKFVPIPTQSASPNAFGRIATDRMYKNLMEVYRWGNMKGEGVYVDYYSRRLTNNYRLQFLNLAAALTDEGLIAEEKAAFLEQRIAAAENPSSDPSTPLPVVNDLPESLEAMKAEKAKQEAIRDERYEKARLVTARCMEEMPEENVPFDRIVPSFIGIAYQVGDNDMGDRLSKRLLQIHTENLDYYFSVGPAFSMRMMGEIVVSRRILMMIYSAARQFGREEVATLAISELERKQLQLEQWAQDIIRFDRRNGGAKLMQLFPELFSPQN